MALSPVVYLSNQTYSSLREVSYAWRYVQMALADLGYYAITDISIDESFHALCTAHPWICEDLNDLIPMTSPYERLDAWELQNALP